ncbi:hypothetical protein H6F44_20635 [Pseudanabaena sp. FACHB-1277]|uniref:Uncharacterized protein n=1 Tax=Pseudanabaena cinerea FACHB-1277 TaxID=2949581 RepID=A0A926UWK2_9CYAN|nr:hypothetical protein [Pseudanabaena cinerea]MBD2152505.1 hypothetical protein [Pseudanabaena cinerea FACHB-1277]
MFAGVQGVGNAIGSMYGFVDAHTCKIWSFWKNNWKQTVWQYPKLKESAAANNA